MNDNDAFRLFDREECDLALIIVAIIAVALFA